MEIPINHWYKLFSPRVVILVTTIDDKGRINAAPYSFCGPLSINPPMLYISARSSQDTYKNIKKTGDFVVNVVSEDFAQKAVSCEKKYPYGVNELEKVGLHWEDSKKVKSPKVTEAKIHFECEFVKEVETGDHMLIIGEIVAVDADVVKENYSPDFTKLKTILQSSGEDFFLVGKEIKLKRE